MKVKSTIVNTYDIAAQDETINLMHESGFKHYESVTIPGSSEMILRFRKVEEI